MVVGRALIIIFLTLFFFCTIFCAPRFKYQKIAQYGNCNLSKEDYDMNNILGHSWNFYKIQGKTYARLVFTVRKKTPPLSMRLAGYKLVKLNSEKKEDFNFNLTCKDNLFNQLYKNVGAKMDMNSCTIMPGTYIVPKANYGLLSELYKYTPQRYSYLIDTYVSTKKGVILCVSSILDLS